MNNNETSQIINELMIEALSIIQAYDLLECLSESHQELAKKILEHYEISDSPRRSTMKLDPDEHMNFVYNVLELNHLQSSFWKYVVKINWLMIALEKDPKLSSQIINSGDMISFYKGILK